MHFRRERVRVETARHEIEGTLQLPSEGFRSRTTDFLNAHGDEFLALTDADVTWLDATRAPERHDSGPEHLVGRVGAAVVVEVYPPDPGGARPVSGSGPVSLLWSGYLRAAGSRTWRSRGWQVERVAGTGRFSSFCRCANDDQRQDCDPNRDIDGSCPGSCPL